MADEERPAEEVQRWTAKRRAALIISLLKGETTAVEAARRHGLKVAEVEGWRDRFLLGAENALRARQKEDEALREDEINRLQARKFPYGFQIFRRLFLFIPLINQLQGQYRFITHQSRRLIAYFVNCKAL